MKIFIQIPIRLTVIILKIIFFILLNSNGLLSIEFAGHMGKSISFSDPASCISVQTSQGNEVSSLFYILL